MVNNKGFIRTLEAVIAIILILVFIFYITPKAPVIIGKVPENVKEAQAFILNKILVDKELRGCVESATVTPQVFPNNECQNALNADCWDKIKKLIEDNIPFGYGYQCEVCGVKTSCTELNNTATKKSVYTHTIFVYKANNEKILRLYFWRTG